MINRMKRDKGVFCSQVLSLEIGCCFICCYEWFDVNEVVHFVPYDTKSGKVIEYYTEHKYVSTLDGKKASCLNCEIMNR